MALVIISLSVYLILPMLILFWFSFDISKDVFVPPREFGFSNWTSAFADPRVPQALFNSFLVWFLVMIIAVPHLRGDLDDPRADQDSLLPGAGVLLLDRLHVPRPCEHSGAG